MLLVKQDVTSGLLELHSTPWGSCQVLSPSDKRCAEFFKLGQTNPTTSSIETDLRTLLSQKYTGEDCLASQIRLSTSDVSVSKCVFLYLIYYLIYSTVSTSNTPHPISSLIHIR